MKILILGMDGYIGWPLALKQLSLGNEVFGIDNFARRKMVEEVGSWSATPILSMKDRMKNLKKEFGDKVDFYEGSLLDSRFTRDLLKKTQPDAIVHLAEQPSAPYSMIDEKHTVDTQENNVIGTLRLLYAMREYSPKAHLIKLGTMGEYGTPEIDIAEGFFDVEFRGRKANIPFPRAAGSWYHWSKVHDSNNIMFACKIWGIKSTDIMQGVVYGTRTDEITNEEKLTRFDFDGIFGTVINRYCAQATIDHPLTIYGKGGQTRGFLALVDSIQCISLLLKNPPEDKEYRVVNQFDEQYSIEQLAKIVQMVGNKKGLDIKIENLDNPRIEKEQHYFKADHEKLKNLGFKRTREIEDEVSIMLDDLQKYKKRILEKKESIIKSDVRWGN